MTESLPATLLRLLRPGSPYDPALEVLLRDYAVYHAVLAGVGGLFLLASVLTCVVFWRRLRRISTRNGTRRWSFERTTYLCFGLLSASVAVFLAFVVSANVSTVVNPRQGFTDSVALLKTPEPGTSTDELYKAVTGWLDSGSTAVPPVVQSRIDDRLAWQRPKAIITSGLLVALVLLSVRLWRALVRRSRMSGGRVTVRDVPLLLCGSTAVVACLLLMLMVMGNTQGSVAPLSLTLFFG